VRADAAHYLAMTRSDSAAAILRDMLNDPDESVRDEAAEALGHR
jgi:HEAT repeat protein